MKTAGKLIFVSVSVAFSACAQAQVPDLLTAFDAGGRALGMGGANNVTGADTLSSYYNPAGLGYLMNKGLGVTWRNMPQSNTVVTGDLVPAGGERLTSTGQSGPKALSHAGFVFPLGKKGGNTKGTIGIALTTGGQIRDHRIAGAGLTEGGLPAGGYDQLLKNRTDFLTIGWGKAMGGSGMNFGISAVYARNNTVNNRSGVPSGSTLYEEQSSGWGALVGLQFVPSNNPNTSFGVSYRSEIKLHSNGGSILLYDKIPARLAAGLAIRKDGMRGGKDYMTLGAEVAHFFSGTTGVFFDRTTQTALGFGGEYNYLWGGSRVPIRLGFNMVQSGGLGYGERKGLTYGLGYHPGNKEWAIDLNFGKPQGGGSDASISLSFRFK